MVDTPGFITLSEGGVVGTLVDIGGVQYTVHAQRSAPVVRSVALEASHVFSAVPARVHRVRVEGATTATWLLLFDAVTAPADGSVTPAAAAMVVAPGSAEIVFGDAPAQFTTGVVAVLTGNASPFTKATGGTGFFFGVVS